eukprot:111359-Chlamydomonas_euryale.AAC.1
MMPLAADSSSLGSPWIAHVRMATGSPRAVMKLNDGLHGMPLLAMPAVHCDTAAARYSAEKAPR